MDATSSADRRAFFDELLGSDVPSRAIRDEFAGLFQLTKYEKTAVFVRQGEPNEAIGFVSQGYLRSYTLDEDGNEATLRFLQPGDLVSGGFAFDVPSPATVDALVRSFVWECPWSRFIDFAQGHPECFRFLRHNLANGTSRMVTMLSNFIRLDAGGRYQLFARQYPELLDTIPHYYIANYLGVTPVQLSRIRSSLR
jgi:CRP-like cAMP-binding protein